jgi:protease-4
VLKELVAYISMKSGIIKSYVLVLSVLVIFGCAGMNVSLLPETKPLEEQVLEGTGKSKILLSDLDGLISFKEEKESLMVKRPSKVAFFREAFLKAEKDLDIAGVIVRISSPGEAVQQAIRYTMRS